MAVEFENPFWFDFQQTHLLNDVYLDFRRFQFEYELACELELNEMCADAEFCSHRGKINSTEYQNLIIQVFECNKEYSKYEKI